MARSTGNRTFVGFGFGPIQSGLFLLEAYLSGNFSRFVAAEVDAALVSAVRAAGNRYVVNVARPDRIDQVCVDGVELYNPRDDADRQRLVQAVAASDEMATALPNIAAYDADGPAAPAAVIADGLAARARAQPTIIYAAENHNQAAEHLTAAIARHVNSKKLTSVQALNTVIGKMSGIIDDPETIGRMSLASLAPGLSRAVLVEEFNRIRISRVTTGVRRGITAFLEKDDLLPFEEAKLYGHNAIHALIGYLAEYRGLGTIAEAGQDGWIMAVGRRAFLEESGPALIRRHAQVRDPLFTPDGFQEYAEDLLQRMICPYLNDRARRVTRDHRRKLGYDDRFFGTMRLCLAAGLQPTNLALGAAAAAVSLIAHRQAAASPTPEQAGRITEAQLRRLLREIWGTRRDDEEAAKLIHLTWEGLRALRAEH